MMQTELPEEQWISSHAPASAHTGSTEQSHTAAGVSPTETAHTLRNTMIRVTKKWEEKSGISFIFKKPENISSDFSVNTRKTCYPQKLRNVVLFFPSSLYLQCMYAVFFCFCIAWKLTNSVLGCTQINQKDFSEDYPSPAECYDWCGALWSYQSLWCQLLETGEPVQS